MTKPKFYGIRTAPGRSLSLRSVVEPSSPQDKSNADLVSRPPTPWRAGGPITWTWGKWTYLLLALLVPAPQALTQTPCPECLDSRTLWVSQFCERKNGTGCNGLGYRPCFGCLGKGYRPCRNCGGAGLTTWITLHNNGTPWRFQSSSTQGCGICCGTGRQACYACSPNTKTLRGLNHPVRMPGLIVCPRCDGSGEVAKRIRCPFCKRSR